MVGILPFLRKSSDVVMCVAPIIVDFFKFNVKKIGSSLREVNRFIVYFTIMATIRFSPQTSIRYTWKLVL